METKIHRLKNDYLQKTIIDGDKVTSFLPVTEGYKSIRRVKTGEHEMVLHEKKVDKKGKTIKEEIKHTFPLFKKEEYEPYQELIDSGIKIIDLN